MQIKRTIKYEADRVRGFSKEITSVSGCDQLKSCIQCGTCSGTCPLSIYMNFSPRQVMALVRADFKNKMLNSMTVRLIARAARTERQLRPDEAVRCTRRGRVKERWRRDATRPCVTGNQNQNKDERQT